MAESKFDHCSNPTCKKIIGARGATTPEDRWHCNNCRQEFCAACYAPDGHECAVKLSA